MTDVFAARVVRGLFAAAFFVFATSVLSEPPLAGAVEVDPFLRRFCLECHGAAKAEGELRLDQLAPQMDEPATRRVWETVLKRLDANEMPPVDAKLRPTAAEALAAKDKLRQQINAAIAKERAINGRVLIRRMNRVEYQNTLHDLLAIDVELKDVLPEDPILAGFDNVDEALRMSAVQMEQYVAAAEIALNAAILPAKSTTKPETKTRRLTYKETRDISQSIEGGKFIGQTPDAAVLFHSGYTPYAPRELWSTPPGRYRIRISAYGYQTHGRPAVMGVYFGNFIPNSGNSHLVGYYDVPPDKPRVIEFEDRFAVHPDTVKPVPYGTGNPWRNDGKIQEHTGPGLAVQWIEIEGPLNDVWPPASHQRLFGTLDLQTATAADIEPLLRAFLSSAFRRPATDSEVQHFVSLAKQKLDAGASFEKALRFAYTAVLCSPKFLFLGLEADHLRQAPAASAANAADDWLLASRLSYFLWSSAPDAELLRLAERGELSQPAVLRAQVERLLADPKSRRFTQNFTGQWLGLRNIDFTTPDKQLYPEFDEFLQWSMVGETRAFFNEVLKENLSLLTFVHADWTMLNLRLAEHYGIEGVTTADFQRVALPANSHRGGVLTQASVLKVTANGTNTSPVIRGAWVLDQILGTPAPPPPANVPAVEPDIRGATTIREQLAKHRTVEVCGSCHRKMDPPGFALENFDVIGGWRERYRITPDPKAKQDRLRLMTTNGDRSVALGPKVDAADTLPSGRSFQNIDDFKQLLLTVPDQIARGLTRKLLVYATGHTVEPSDQAAVEAIVARVKTQNYGFRSLIHELVQSDVFRKK